MRYTLSTFLLLFTCTFASCQSQNDYRAFKELFPDYFSTHSTDKGILLPATDFTQEFLGRGVEFSPEDIEAGASDNMYIVGKIENYRGFDLFILNYESSRPDEDSYDNHGDITRFIIVFKDGKLVFKKSAYDSDDTWVALDQYYDGEGGSMDFSSTIQKDTTIISKLHMSESESATGFATPLITHKQYRWRIGKDGRPETLGYDQFEFSSPFFSASYPTENNLQPSEDQERFYPISEEGKLEWSVEPSPLLSGNDCSLSFHYQYIESGYQGVIKLYNGGEWSDEYIIGYSPFDKNTEGDYPGVHPELKCPVIIHTSDGIVEVTPDGYLNLVDPDNIKYIWPEWKQLPLTR